MLIYYIIGIPLIIWWVISTIRINIELLEELREMAKEDDQI